ncbi:hypothetical protein K7432_001257 [Basidiobolus ranarum]|uniref:Uncharacterized protein n=1 Tax=Basidiobolus ranarum TaxID=34480 RepID=A0ABR2W9Z3_9FUNG
MNDSDFSTFAKISTSHLMGQNKRDFILGEGNKCLEPKEANFSIKSIFPEHSASDIIRIANLARKERNGAIYDEGKVKLKGEDCGKVIEESRYDPETEQEEILKNEYLKLLGCAREDLGSILNMTSPLKQLLRGEKEGGVTSEEYEKMRKLRKGESEMVGGARKKQSWPVLKLQQQELACYLIKSLHETEEVNPKWLELAKFPEQVEEQDYIDMLNGIASLALDPTSDTEKRYLVDTDYHPQHAETWCEKCQVGSSRMKQNSRLDVIEFEKTEFAELNKPSKCPGCNGALTIRKIGAGVWNWDRCRPATLSVTSALLKMWDKHANEQEGGQQVVAIGNHLAAEFIYYSRVIAQLIASKHMPLNGRPTSLIESARWPVKWGILPDDLQQILSDAEGATSRYCTDDCGICISRRSDSWGDIAINMGRADLYGRLHPFADEESVWWIGDCMIMASYLDTLGKLKGNAASKALKYVAHTLANQTNMATMGTANLAVLTRTLLNTETYFARRQMWDRPPKVFKQDEGIAVELEVPLGDAVFARLYEGMTLPYNELFSISTGCMECVDWVRFGGTLSIVAHDAMDFTNDILSGENMNIFRMVASKGFAVLKAFAIGVNEIIRVLTSVDVVHKKCSGVIRASIGASLSWYFCCCRYRLGECCAVVMPATEGWAGGRGEVALACRILQVPSRIEKTLCDLVETNLVVKDVENWCCPEPVKMDDMTTDRIKRMIAGELDAKEAYECIALNYGWHCSRSVHANYDAGECSSCTFSQLCAQEMLKCGTLTRFVEFGALYGSYNCFSEKDK